MQGIINFQQSIDVSSLDYEDNQGFFFRCTTAGNIKYVAMNNADAQALTEAFDASVKFDNPILARKIFSSGTTASGIIIGKSL